MVGLTTGVIYTDKLDFEIELNLRDSQLTVATTNGQSLHIDLHGQNPSGPAREVFEFLVKCGISTELTNPVSATQSASVDFPNYSAGHAKSLAEAIGGITASLESFRADLREETSPIQLWPHQFDLAMLWLPGEKITDQDPADEESSDKHMNFGFTFGDQGIPEPYFYITAYPAEGTFATHVLPDGVQWHTEGFTGAVLLYRQLLTEANPYEFLIDFWKSLLVVGKSSLTANS